MKCPHCLVEFHAEKENELIHSNDEGFWGIEKNVCPSCNNLVLLVVVGKQTDILEDFDEDQIINIYKRILVYPKNIGRNPPPPEVPQDIADDYREASLVLQDSPKASAALSRRCLQSILRDAAHVKEGFLSAEIQEVLKRGDLPSHISQLIDGIRNIGIFAAHPLKDINTAEIITVELVEAEFDLDVIEVLFDYYYVQPAKRKIIREKINKKLADAGKPPMK